MMDSSLSELRLSSLVKYILVFSFSLTGRELRWWGGCKATFRAALERTRWLQCTGQIRLRAGATPSSSRNQRNQSRPAVLVHRKARRSDCHSTITWWSNLATIEIPKNWHTFLIERKSNGLNRFQSASSNREREKNWWFVQFFRTLHKYSWEKN